MPEVSVCCRICYKFRSIGVRTRENVHGFSSCAEIQIRPMSKRISKSRIQSMRWQSERGRVSDGQPWYQWDRSVAVVHLQAMGDAVGVQRARADRNCQASGGQDE